MTTGAFELDLARLQQLHQCWTADAQQVSRLLGSKALMHWSDCDSLTLCHRVDDVAQNTKDLRGQNELFPIRTRQCRGWLRSNTFEKLSE